MQRWHLHSHSFKTNAYLYLHRLVNALHSHPLGVRSLNRSLQKLSGVGMRLLSVLTPLGDDLTTCQIKGGGVARR